MATSNPDTKQFLIDRGATAEATVARFIAGYGGAITMQSLSLAEWNARELGPTDLLPFARGWHDSDGDTVIFSPTMIAVTTSALPAIGDGSLDAYLDLVTTTWAAEFHAIRNGGCTVDEAIEVARRVVGAAEGAQAFLDHLAAEAIDELLGTGPAYEDDGWADEMGLT